MYALDGSPDVKRIIWRPAECGTPSLVHSEPAVPQRVISPLWSRGRSWESNWNRSRGLAKSCRQIVAVTIRQHSLRMEEAEHRKSLALRVPMMFAGAIRHMPQEQNLIE
jgi:hypothetical protein